MSETKDRLDLGNPSPYDTDELPYAAFLFHKLIKLISLSLPPIICDFYWSFFHFLELGLSPDFYTPQRWFVKWLCGMDAP